jgi:hypothetical protein
MLLAVALPAYAQDNSTTVVPLPPPVMAAPAAPQALTAPPAAVAPAPVTPTQIGQNPAPGQYDNGDSQPAPDQSATTAAPAAPAVPPATTPPQPPNTWLPGTTAVLGVLDKVDGSSSSVTIPPQPPNTWLPGTTAVLGVLDKVDGSSSSVTIPVGGQAIVGDLQVSVLACANRPATEIPDTAIFISTQNAPGAANSPLYRGWMVRSMPGATVAGDADEIFRVVSCS